MDWTTEHATLVAQCLNRRTWENLRRSPLWIRQSTFWEGYWEFEAREIAVRWEHWHNLACGVAWGIGQPAR